MRLLTDINAGYFKPTVATSHTLSQVSRAMGAVSDFFARSQTAFFRFFADTFFAKRYGHRAVVLETIAGVPGMVAGMWIHLKSLRSMKTGYGPLIRELLAEAATSVCI